MKKDELFPYEDILSLPCPKSDRHAPMPRLDRAAQFSPYAALTGFGDVVGEALNEKPFRPALGEEEEAALNDAIRRLEERSSPHPGILLSYFVPGETTPEGERGTSVSRPAELKDLDGANRVLFLTDGTAVPFDDLLFIAFAAPSSLDREGDR